MIKTANKLLYNGLKNHIEILHSSTIIILLLTALNSSHPETMEIKPCYTYRKHLRTLPTGVKEKVRFPFCINSFLLYFVVIFRTTGVQKKGRNMNNRRNLAGGVPGIPASPGGKRIFQTVDYDFQERKLRLGHKLPFLTKEEVGRRKHPYHVLLLHDLMSRGYFLAVQEMNNIFRKEDRERKGGKYRHLMGDKLITDKDKFNSVLEVLQNCQDYTDQDNYESPTLIRKAMGEKLMKTGDIWLAKHFLYSSLQACDKIKSEHRLRLEAEIHCLLAFLARDNADNLEQALESAVDHLTVCRELTKDQPWQFKPKILSIKLKKPITLHGLRDEYEVVDGSSMTLYMIATLLEHEMLISLANQTLHLHRYPTEDDIQQAHVFADNALKLAFEVRQPVALSSALMRFGVVLRHTGAFDDAITYFKQLVHHSEITGDNEGNAIAYHNIAMCQIGKHESTLALESLTRQKDISDMFKLEDLQADALQELGHILLQEGQLWEAEECYTCAFDIFDRLEKTYKPPHSHCDNNLAMWAIAAGQKLWSRFTGLARNETFEHLNVMMEWKNRRQALVPVPKPNYKTEYIKDDMEQEFTTAPAQSDSVFDFPQPSKVLQDEVITDTEKIRKVVVFRTEVKSADGDRQEEGITGVESDIDDLFESDRRPIEKNRGLSMSRTSKQSRGSILNKPME